MHPHPKQERTFLLVKPDGVRKGLIGEVLQRIEQRDLKVIALGMTHPSRDYIDSHYPKDAAWISRLGEKALGTFEKHGIDPVPVHGTTDAHEIGTQIRGWLVGFMSSGPVVKMVVEGVHAVDTVRKIVGKSIPALAELGTIRGDFSIDSPLLAGIEKRPIMNIVHASETAAEAANEIALWFKKEELHSYERLTDNL